MGITEQQFRQLLDNQTRAAGRAAKPKREPGAYRSKTEAAYAGYLEVLRKAGLVDEWRYEPATLKLAEGVRYTPDFLVRFREGGLMVFHEVKGRKLDSFWSRPVGKVKVRLAAALFPWWTFAVVWPMGAAWDHWEVPSGEPRY
ncbi:MAG TPA: hypothetical protein VN442_14230 [Bryobacteraceae bacterium]|nr:hypothetical protein [Bryobacteraceae bacterium]